MAIVEGSAPHPMLVDSGGLVEDLRVHLQKLQDFIKEWHYQQEYLLRSFGKGKTFELSHGSFNGSNLPTSQIAPTSREVRGFSWSTSQNDIEVHVDEDGMPSYEEVALNIHNEISRITGSNPHVERPLSFTRFEKGAGRHEDEANSDEEDNPPKRIISAIGDSQAPLGTCVEHSATIRNSSIKIINQMKVSEIVKARMCEMLVACVILANTFVIALESDISIKNPNEQLPSYMKYCETSFIIFYTIEIGIRIWAKGCDYFKQADERTWNLFDFVLVVHGLVEQTISFIQAQDEGLSSVSFLRMFRLMKVLKVLRAVRLLRTFRELRLILCSIGGCVASMSWTLALVVSVSFLFGLVFLQACGDYLRDVDNVDKEVERAIEEWWGSVATSMLSLFMSTMGGQDWLVIAEPLKHVSGFVYSLFILYIVFFSFVVINVVSSIFFEAIMAHSAKDDQLTMLNYFEKKEDYLLRLENLYQELDQENDGEVTYESFCSHLTSPNMLEFLTVLDLDAADARHIFLILSEKGKHPVGHEEFVTGCIKLKGPAKSVDLIDLLHRMSTQQDEQRRMSIELHDMAINNNSGRKAIDNVAQGVLHDLKKLLQEFQSLVSRAAGGVVVSPWKSTSLQL